jgi:predicted alpha-1,2-mannosidase
MMGGDQAFINRLDKFFTMKSQSHGDIADMSGMIGQYVQGNEPDMQTPYMYNYAGAPWKTQAIVRKITNNLYKNANNGLPGNEDCGQMSAWYIFSAIGFYPVNPASGKFIIGSPVFNKLSIKVSGGQYFTLIAKNNSHQNKYIQSATLNGDPYDKNYINYADIMMGGTLILNMGDKPNKKWGSVRKSRP